MYTYMNIHRHTRRNKSAVIYLVTTIRKVDDREGEHGLSHLHSLNAADVGVHARRDGSSPSASPPSFLLSKAMAPLILPAGEGPEWENEERDRLDPHLRTQATTRS